MCGINGIFAYLASAPAVDIGELRQTRDSMAARGPDAHGEWISPDRTLGLGHRRLAIIDLSRAGAQPMQSADGSYVITFNGEIYNYRALREALEARGRRFVTQSDTEVLLQLFAEKGEAMLDDLRGMYAFAIWDRHRSRLFLARDPFGIKPLYYSTSGGTFRFASQVKALLSGGRVSRSPDPAGIVGFCLWGSVPEPFTICQEVHALSAGSFLSVERGVVSEPKSFCSLASIHCAAEQDARAVPAADRQQILVGALRDTVKHHLVADVSVGAFLSGGVDSGALVGLMRDVGANDIQTVTLAFEEFRGHDDDEGPLAREVADYYGTRHVTRNVSRREFEGDLPKLLEAMDQPSIDGVNTWFVSKAAQECGLKVAVSGLGGDELFGGYPSFRDIPMWVNRLAPLAHFPSAAAGFRKFVVRSGLSDLLGSPKAAGLLEFGGTVAGAYLVRRGVFMPWEIEQIVGREMAQAGLKALQPLVRVDRALQPSPKTCYGKIAVLESALYMRNQLLRDTDWASMAFGLEVRVPLVDLPLLKKIAPLIGAQGHAGAKHELARAPMRPLPSSVINRKKTGFAVPIRQWLTDMRGASVHAANQHKGRASREWARALLDRIAA